MTKVAVLGSGQVGQVLADAASEIPVGQRFGPYRVTGFVASGGMGAVYRAVRDDGPHDGLPRFRRMERFCGLSPSQITLAGS